MTKPAPLKSLGKQAAEKFRAARFVAAPAAFTGTRLAFVAPFDERISLYLFVHVADTERSAWLWVAPRDFPDDRLEGLRAGFKIVLASTMAGEDVPSFIDVTAQRVTALVNAGLTPIAHVAATEVQRVPPGTVRLERYRAERNIVQWLREHRGDSKDVSALYSRLEECVQKESTLAPAGEAARKVVRMMLAARATRALLNAWIPTDDDDETYASSFARIVAEALYLDVLLSAAVAKRR